MKLRRIIAAWSGERGAIAPFAAIALAVTIGLVAMSTDLGSWFAQRRGLQAATDAAALAAVADQGNLKDRNVGAILNDAALVLAENNRGRRYTASNISTPVLGTYCPDEAVKPAERFRSAIALCPGDTRDPSYAMANAVKLEVQDTASAFLSKVLQPSLASFQIRTSATAARIDEAGFQVGTGLAAVDTAKSQLLNAVLGNLLGTNVALTFADYNGLLNADVQALAFLDALNTQLSIKAGTYDELLTTTVSVSQVIDAEIAALNAPGSVAALALNALKASLTGAETLALGDLLDLGVWRNQPIGGSTTPTALQAGLNFLQIATFAIQVANGKNAVSIPAFSLGVKGIVSIDVTATVIEPPQSPPFAFGPIGISVHTGQVRLQLTLKVLEGISWLIGAQVPLYIEVASGDAFLADISCSNDPLAETTVTIKGRSSVVNVYIGKVMPGNPMTNFTQPVTIGRAPLTTGLIGALLATVYVSANISVGTPADETDRDSYPSLTFTKSEIDAGATKRFVSEGMARNLLSQLLSTLHVEAYLVLGLAKVDLSAASLGAINSLLANVLGGLLDSVVDPLLQALGIELGYMDVTVTGVRCGVPVLIQ